MQVKCTYAFSALKNSALAPFFGRKMAQQAKTVYCNIVLLSIIREFHIPTGEVEELHYSDGKEIAV